MTHSTALAAALLGICLAAPLHATATQCDTLIDGEAVTIFYDSADPGRAGLRERVFGRDEACPASVVITYLTPDLSAAERAVFCANYNPETRSHSHPAIGRRDRLGRCVEPSKTCALVNSTRQEAMALVGMAESSEGARQPGLLSSAISTVTHSSGAMILSGNTGTLTGILGTALSTPAVLAGAAASVVVVGGAVYLCSD